MYSAVGISRITAAVIFPLFSRRIAKNPVTAYAISPKNLPRKWIR